MRDAQNRITQVIDPAGRSVGYDYDGNGNLVRHIDVLTRDTRFRYGNAAFPHHLTSIIDHRGVEIAALQYQADGRLGQTCDPDGVCLRQSYDLAAQVMTQIDGLGRPTVYTYDARGRIGSETNALDQTTSYLHHSDRVLSSVTYPDGSGFTREFAHGVATDDIASETPNTAPGEDPAAFRTSWTYDGLTHRPLTQTLPTGGTHHYAYDAAGNETSVTDDDGRVVFDRDYDTRGRPTSITDRFGTTTFEYGDDRAQPTRVVYPDLTDARMTYDAMGNVATLTRAGVTMRYLHDAEGRMLFADYGRGVSVSYEYGGPGNAWTAIQGPSFGRVERRFSGSGRLVGWTLPNGDVWSRTYDLQGHVLTETGPDGNVRRSTYDLAGRLLTTEDVGRSAVTTYERDSVGRVLATIDALTHRTESTYDLRGALRTLTDARGKVTTFDETPQASVRTDPLTRTTTSARASYGLPAGTTLPGGATTSSTYNGATTVDESGDYARTRVDELGRTRVLSYDARSTLVGATDVGGVNEWTYAYAPVLGGDVSWDLESGRVSLGASSAESGVGQFAGRDESRDAATPEDLQNATGEALADVRTPSGELTHRMFDARGHLSRLELPNGGIETRGYDAAGRHTQTVLALGVTLTYVLDDAGRVMSRTGSDGSSQSWTYGPGDRVETFTDGTGTTTLGYDAASRWTSLTSPTGARWSRTFDALDRVTSVSVKAPAEPTGRTTLYGHDNAGNITRIEDPFGGVTTQVYDDAGQMTSRTLPNGVVSSWAYNERGWVMEVAHRTSTGDLIALSRYARSASGEPARIEREDGSAVDIGYDEALRVTSEAYSDDGEEIGYGYDVDSNRTSRVTSAGSETYAYLAGALLAAVSVTGVPAETFAYDDAGRVTDLRGAAVSWDADHVTALGAHSWSFDAQGRRMHVDGVEHLVAPTLDESLESPWLVMDATGAARVGYVFAGEHPVARYDATTHARVYYLTDAMGSVIALVGDSPSDRATIHYDGFGSIRRTTGLPALAAIPSETGGDFRFQGMWSDAGTGLYYVHARVYDPRVGRFLSRDEGAGDPTQPETFTSYALSRNNTLVWRDRSGRDATLPEVQVAQVVQRELQASSVSSGAVIRALAWIRNLHHAIPKFLGGATEQLLAQAPAFVHRAFHSIPQIQLRAAGIPALGSTAAYLRYFQENPGMQARAFNAVLTASRQVDVLFGTRFVQAFWTALYSGQFTSFM